ncbi:hypothetical protein BRC68_10485 [Halobacteriales archaeon QH_6_64_20]|nr:MAG: hypothetical protein BRC68_10485 [Halobacteriales archaeon QH_6_64_20]
MTETIPADTAIEPERLLNEGRVDTERLTLTHENGDHYRDHCETDAIGRAIVGVTDADDRLLLVVNFENGHATLPNQRRGRFPDGLCADNPFELGWCDAVPVAMDDAGTGVLDDIRLFLD